jgi:hypothetical protein
MCGRARALTKSGPPRAQVDAAKKREAATAAADRRAKAARGWVGWLWGGGGGKKAAPGDGQGVDADAEMRGDLTPEDEEALKELATEQEDALRLGAALTRARGHALRPGEALAVVARGPMRLGGAPLSPASSCSMPWKDTNRGSEPLRNGVIKRPITGLVHEYNLRWHSLLPN